MVLKSTCLFHKGIGSMHGPMSKMIHKTKPMSQKLKVKIQINSVKHPNKFSMNINYSQTDFKRNI